MKKKIFTLCILIFILLTTACRRGDNENEVILTPDGLIQRTLTVRGNTNFIAVVEQARNMLNESWQERGYNYYLSINIERHEEIPWTGIFDEAVQIASDIRQMRLRTELMAGTGPDLIFNEDFPLYQFAQGGHLMDFYTLMDICNRTSRYDFFVNVLEANEFRGGLYELPIVFWFHYIGINENMPDSILNRFTQSSYIRVSDLIELYFDFLDNYNEFLYFGCLRWLSLDPTGLNIMNHINLATNKVDLGSPSFIERFILADRVEFEIHHAPQRGWDPVENVRTLVGTHMFYNGLWGFNSGDAFIDRDIPFGHFIPLANDYGSLVLDIASWRILNLNTVNPRIWMPATGNTLLAWEFVYYIIIAFSEPEGMAATLPGLGFEAQWGNTQFNIPIMRSLFESNLQATFETFLHRAFGFQFPTEEEDEEDLELEEFEVCEEFERLVEEFRYAIQNAIERIYVHANMPMVLRRPHLPMNLILEPLEDFALGLITSMEAITRAQNAMTLWLME